MTKCYYCGGYIEPVHRTDADIGHKKVPAHKSCASRNKEDSNNRLLEGEML